MGDEVRFFAAPSELRDWLEKHHTSAPELWVGFYKRGSGRPSITWPESVDEALCFGWIDGLRKSIDGASYKIRFTPRRAGSIWSAVNIGRVAALIAEGRMRPAGLRAFEARSEERSAVYSHEQRPELGPEQEARFQASEAAWRFFQKQPPWYRRTATHWVMSAKREETRRRRLEQLIADSAAGRPIRSLDRTGGARGGVEEGPGDDER